MPENLLSILMVPGLHALLHMTALILALVYYRRCPGACPLVVAASLMNLAVTVGRVVVQTVWLPRDGDFATFGILMAGFSLVNWAAYGLMIVAVFVGRNPPAPAPYRSARDDGMDDDDWSPPAAAPQKAPEGTGIQPQIRR